MKQNTAPALRPIHKADFEAVGQFLHTRLNARLSPADWAAAMVPSWGYEGPNHGYMLVVGDDIVGVQLAFYSMRETSGGPVRLCNVAALCVLPEYRAHTLRLFWAILAQPGFSFTDLSPSGNVRPLNLRLGFQMLDTTAVLVANLLSLPTVSQIRLVSDQQTIGETVAGPAHQIFQDHRFARGARQLLLVRGDRQCLVLYRRDRRKGLPLFATILYVSDPDLFARGRGQVFRHLLLRYGIPFTLMELRIVGARPPLSVLLPGHRPKIFRSQELSEGAVDYLYSELTSVAW